MAKTVAARKNKGRVLQKLMVAKILAAFPDLTERDVRSTSMGQTGSDVQLSEYATDYFPFSVECKNQEAVGPIYTMWEQCESNHETLTPILVIKKNHEKPLVIMDLDRFFEFVRKFYNG